MSKPSAATSSLLARYQQAMRDELARLLDDIAGKPAPAGLLDDGAPPPIVRPSLADAAKLWDLAIKLGRELGAEVDPGPLPGAEASVAKPRRRARIDFG